MKCGKMLFEVGGLVKILWDSVYVFLVLLKEVSMLCWCKGVISFQSDIP